MQSENLHCSLSMPDNTCQIMHFRSYSTLINLLLLHEKAIINFEESKAPQDFQTLPSSGYIYMALCIDKPQNFLLLKNSKHSCVKASKLE